MASVTKELFATVPERDYLGLFADKEPQYNLVAEFLKFRKRDVSGAAGIPSGAVRYDARIPPELADRMREWAVLLDLVAEHFGGDAQKTSLWFTMRNPLLGDVAPREMIRFGRTDKLTRFVQNALAENRR